MVDEIPQEVFLDYQNRTVVSVSDLQWNNAEHTMLTANVLFDELEDLGPVPFTTFADADTAHGVEVWTKALAGEYGAISEYTPPPPHIPQVVSRFQARAALHLAGHLPAVEAAILASDPLTQMAWQDAQEFRRNSPTILSLAAVLGLSDNDVDDLFIAASEILA